jgi:hypothetical protein
MQEMHEQRANKYETTDAMKFAMNLERSGFAGFNHTTSYAALHCTARHCTALHRTAPHCKHALRASHTLPFSQC